MGELTNYQKQLIKESMDINSNLANSKTEASLSQVTSKRPR
jgi:hypothetical protein